MNKKAIDHPPTLTSRSSPGVHEPSPKRRKLDGSNNSEMESWETELLSLRMRLSKSEATVTQLHRIRSEIEEMFEKEKELQQWQVKVDAEMIDQLHKALDEATTNADNALEAKKSAESQVIQMKARMEEEISILSIENARLKNEISSESDNKLAEKLKMAELRIIELEEKLEDKMISQMEFNLLNVELEQTTKQQLKLEETSALEKKNLATRVQELEKQSKSFKNIIANLSEVFKEIGVFKQDKLETAEAVKDQEIVLEETGDSSALKIAELRSKIRENLALACVNEICHESSQINDREEFLSKVSNHSSPGDEPEDVNEGLTVEESPVKSLQMMAGDYHILVSDQKFFGIDWENEYIYEEDKYNCSSCEKSEADRMRIEDHVWNVHFRGYFECPTCLDEDSPCSLAYRDDIIRHIETFHPYLI
ncbi:myosin-6-like [Fopius arisanus]|uniref:Myosin-6-like n=1 Tax=Fopius arisanus TaxID=64838 RepID=A0A9R1TLZ2_9HYME|nr:PREDICTED: myosin-6-like [Fopius arisanus]